MSSGFAARSCRQTLGEHQFHAVPTLFAKVCLEIRSESPDLADGNRYFEPENSPPSAFTCVWTYATLASTGRPVHDADLRCLPANLVSMPPMPGFSTSDRQQQIGQDTTENERESKQELQNRIHHGFLQGDLFDARAQKCQRPYVGDTRINPRVSK